MKFKYTLKHIWEKDEYVVEVILSKLYRKWDTLMVWTEEFLIENRVDA